jgi:hypothetical protein
MSREEKKLCAAIHSMDSHGADEAWKGNFNARTWEKLEPMYTAALSPKRTFLGFSI